MKPKKKSRRRWLIATIVIILLGAGIAYYLRPKASGIEVNTGKVERGDVTATVSATGKIQPEVVVRISSEVPGEIVEIAVKEGTEVARGDLLARVNPDTLEAQHKQQQASLSATKATAAQNKAQMLQAELDLKRIEKLYEEGYTTEDQLEQSRTELEVRKASYEASVFQIERQQMQLEEATRQLDKSNLYAPIDGTVIYLASEVGDRVVGTGQFEGTEIMQLANLNSMEVSVEVSESDIVHITPGDPAEVEIDAIPNVRFQARVSEIAHSAETSEERSQEQLTTFNVKVRFDEVDKRLRPGMSATAEISTDHVENALKVPLLAVVVRPAREVSEALGENKNPPAEGPPRADAPAGPRRPGAGAAPGRSRNDQQRIVFVVEGNTVSMRKVETGIADKNSIEITSGLSEGDTIVTGSYRALTRELQHQSEISPIESTGRPW